MLPLVNCYFKNEVPSINCIYLFTLIASCYKKLLLIQLNNEIKTKDSMSTSHLSLTMQRKGNKD
ncbi:hypothetical protein EV200_101250 [Pedobacter psychrotolerans]|uniref:Uncharacterized protein n=1 Tax=Pedobacter psychrotolerans TaxID=1843235 RepID=A0A4R2HQ44_9SPHI|nr:hypothetical protein EV200_101250 [Pedobacter psychrotolerans]